MIAHSLDTLFACLQPYLKVLHHDSLLIARQIRKSLIQAISDESHISDAELDKIVTALSKKGVVQLDNEIKKQLKYELKSHREENLISETIIATIEDKLSKATNLDIKLKNPDRLRILECFFPRFPVYQPEPDGSSSNQGKVREVAYRIEDLERRNFYTLCLEISKDKSIYTYIGNFFSGDTRNSRILRDLFTEAFISNAQTNLLEMESYCSKYLKEIIAVDSWAEEQIIEFRNVLLSLGCNMVERLQELPLPAQTQSLMFPSSKKEIRAKHYTESIRNQARENPLHYTLARVIASAGIIVDTNVSTSFSVQEQAICNIWGWSPRETTDIWQEKMAEGIIAYNDGRYNDAWELFKATEHLRGISNFSGPHEAKDFADMLCLQAHLMMTEGYGVEAGEDLFKTVWQKMDHAWQIAVENSVCSSKMPYSARSCYEFTYYSYRKLDGTNGILSNGAKKCLAYAVNEKLTDAVLFKAHLWLSGEYGCKKNPDKGIALLENDSYFINASNAQKRERITMLADYYSTSSYPQIAERYLEEAARLGSYAATVRLREMHMKTECGHGIVLGIPNDQSVCLFNSDPIASPQSLNAVLLSSLSKDIWKHEILMDGAAISDDYLYFLNYGRIVFSLMSDNEEKNLTDAITLIQQLNAIAVHQEESVRSSLIERIDIFLLNTSEACPLLIDATMGNLGANIYFKVHICDPDMSAANELLIHLPTFLPCISRETGEIRSETWEGMGLSQRCKRRIVILGTNRAVEVLIKQIIATTFLANYPTELTVVGSNADAMRERCEEECPGLDSTVDRYISSYIIPSFYQHALDRLPLNYAHTNSDIELQQILKTADYFIVSGTDDYENLALGVKLRRNLLRHNPDPVKKPYIAVRYQDNHSAWIASQVAVTSKNYTVENGWSIRHHWSEDYDLHLFGSNAAFTCDALFDNYIERQALELHKSYYGTMYETDPNAEGAFYRRSYNRDSSVAAFIGIIYQCFGAGVYYRNDTNAYKNDCHILLGKWYYSFLHDYCPVCKAQAEWRIVSDDDNQSSEHCSVCKQTKREINAATLEKSAAIEHARWRCFCASRGWSTPDEAVMTNYLLNGNPKHLLEIGLLHPYMVGYSNLPNIRDRINHLIEKNNLEIKRLPDPCTPDREFVLKAPLLLGYRPPTGEKE